jgi:hypothetical protein
MRLLVHSTHFSKIFRGTWAPLARVAWCKSAEIQLSLLSIRGHAPNQRRCSATDHDQREPLYGEPRSSDRKWIGGYCRDFPTDQRPAGARAGEARRGHREGVSRTGATSARGNVTRTRASTQRWPVIGGLPPLEVQSSHRAVFPSEARARASNPASASRDRWTAGRASATGAP